MRRLRSSSSCSRRRAAARRRSAPTCRRQQPGRSAAGVQARRQSLCQGHLRQRHHRERPGARARTSTSIPRSPGPITAGAGRRGADGAARATPLLRIDDSVQRATAEQQQAQAEAARGAARGAEGRSRGRRPWRSPRPRSTAPQASAQERRGPAAPSSSAPTSIDPQVGQPRRARQRRATPARSPQPTSRSSQRQYELTKAGAWSYDIRNQEKQYAALAQGGHAPTRAARQVHHHARPADGVVLVDAAPPWAATSRRRAPTTPTPRASSPLIVMGSAARTTSQVRCYVDEILIHRLPDPPRDHGADVHPRHRHAACRSSSCACSPTSRRRSSCPNERQEQVDVRVLPVIFRFRSQRAPRSIRAELVDVYIGKK